MSVPNPIPARVHLLRAHDAPIIAVIRRGPSKLFHIIKWNTETDELEYGSWFRGKLYWECCDVSFDGKWMIYLALGDKGEAWNGCCQLPYLKTFMESEVAGSWDYGGGYWSDAQTLVLNRWIYIKGQVPFQTRKLEFDKGQDKQLFALKMARDGWKRNGDNWGTIKMRGRERPVVGDDGWSWQFDDKGPTLQCFARGEVESGTEFEFRVLDNPELLDETVEWATFDARGHLVVARAGWIERYAPENIASGHADFRFDLNGLARPPRENKAV